MNKTTVEPAQAWTSIFLNTARGWQIYMFLFEWVTILGFSRYARHKVEPYLRLVS